MENHIKYSKAVSWFNDCRIPFEDTQNPATNPKYRLQGNYKMPEKGQISDGSITQFRSSLNEIDVRGRFPANILVSDDMLNDGAECKNKNTKNRYYPPQYKDTSDVYGKYTAMPVIQYADKGSNSRYYDIDKWFEKLLND